MEMKYVGYSIEKLIEETLKEGFKEESYKEPRPSFRKFTKWANGIAHKLRWIEIPSGPLFIPAYPEKRRKLAEKKQAEESKKLQVGTEAKRGINWDEHIIDYNDENFDKFLKELEKLSNEVSKKEKNLEQRWDVMKHKLHNIAKNNLKKKHAPSEVLKQLESEKDVPLYLSTTLQLEWKDAICGGMVDEIEAMKGAFYDKYRDFISSITLDTSDAFTYLTKPILKGHFEHNRFTIEGYKSKKQLEKLLKFIKLYKITFGSEIEKRPRGRPGYSFELTLRVFRVFLKFYKKYEKIQAEIKRVKKLPSKDHSYITDTEKREITKKGVDYKIVDSISKRGAYEAALESTTEHFKDFRPFGKKPIGKWQVIKMIRSKGYKSKFKLSKVTNF